MPILLTLGLSAAAVYAVARGETRKPSAAKLRAAAGAAKAPLSRGEGATTLGLALRRLDAGVQHGFQAYFDPMLVGAARARELAKLDRTRQPSLQEKAVNRNLAASGAVFGLAVVRAATAAPLAPFILAGAAWQMAPIFWEGWRIAREERRFSLFHLFSVYVSSLWLSGVYVVGGLGLIFFQGVSKLEYLTKSAAQDSLTNLMKDAPDTVWILTGEVELAVPFDRVVPGDVAVVRSGQTIPLDGVVVMGEGMVDQHRLTGESQPVERKVGDAVLAGSLLLGGSLCVRVTRAGSDTVAAKIQRVLEKTVEQDEERMGDRFIALEYSRWPTVAGAAVGWLLGGPIAGLAVLGCNYMPELIPLRSITLLNWLRSGAERGILVKDGSALERLPAVSTLVFDKTGTLTLEALRVAAVHCDAGVDVEEALRIAALAEASQTHPIAKAILAEAAARGLRVDAIHEISTRVGMGVEAEYEGRTIHVGGPRYMAASGVRVSPALRDQEDRVKAAGRAVVFVAVDGVALAVIELAATLRPGVPELIAKIKARGTKVWIMSGDQEAPTRALADALAIDGFDANLLPEQKAEAILRLQAQGETVCFVGDGINDAVALRAADASISLAGATTVATDCADIVLMRGDLADLAVVLDLADGFAARMAANSNAARAFSVAAGALTILLPFKFLIVELMWLGQTTTGLSIALKSTACAEGAVKGERPNSDSSRPSRQTNRSRRISRPSNISERA